MPDWLDELDLHPGPPEASMGTHALDASRWLCIDDDWTDQRQRSRRLLHDRRDDVLASGATAAAREIGGRIDRFLAARRPDLVDGAHADEADPLAAARIRVAEDLCVLTGDERGWVLEAGAVCFPSYWRLHEKVGRPLADVHGLVPGYAGPLAGRVEGFLGRLGPDQGVWRRNWSIHATDDLFAPAHAEGGGPLPAPPDRWLRSEYQTLLRLEVDNAVVFTIRTQQVPIRRLASRPDRCGALVAALRGWTDAQRTYKGDAVDEQLLDWLDGQAGSTAP